jgi:hypothetical protein
MWRLEEPMRETSFLQTLRDAMQQAVRKLENVKLVRPGEDPKIERLMRELRSAIPYRESDCETMNAD